jgi:ketosteroid isomerase-like protein
MSADSPLAAVQQYIDAFNTGDVDRMAASFADSAAILDGMPPHLWQGPNATRDWYRDVLAEGEQHGASGYFVTIGDAVHNDVSGDRAYVVLPATMTFTLNGNKMTQSGASFTVALHKLSDGWRIAAWAWTKGKQ